jgi:prenyltransferase beta subunit
MPETMEVKEGESGIVFHTDGSHTLILPNQDDDDTVTTTTLTAVYCMLFLKNKEMIEQIDKEFIATYGKEDEDGGEGRQAEASESQEV